MKSNAPGSQNKYGFNTKTWFLVFTFRGMGSNHGSISPCHGRHFWRSSAGWDVEANSGTNPLEKYGGWPILHQLIGGLSRYLDGFNMFQPRWCRILQPSAVSQLKIMRILRMDNQEEIAKVYQRWSQNASNRHTSTQYCVATACKASDVFWVSSLHERKSIRTPITRVFFVEFRCNRNFL